MTTPALTLNNGVAIPAVGLGVFQTPPDETRDAVAAALDAGYRHIDTAAAYGNEREVGEALAVSGVDRAEVFLETKVWISDFGYDETLHAFDKSAGKLGVEQIDLLILTALLDRAKVVPAVNQIEQHPYFSQADVQAFGEQHGILAQAWSPIGGITFYSVIPKSTEPERIAENLDVFDFELSPDQMAAIDGLDTGRRGGPEPDDVTLEAFGRDIPEA